MLIEGLKNWFVELLEKGGPGSGRKPSLGSQHAQIARDLRRQARESRRAGLHREADNLEHQAVHHDLLSRYHSDRGE